MTDSGIEYWVEDEFILVGIETQRGKPSRALLAREGSWGLEYAGAAEIACSDLQGERLRHEADRLKSDYPHVKVRSSTAHWVQPQLKVLTVHRTGGRLLRQAKLTTVIGV